MSIDAMRQALEAAYLAGFYRSGEGYNSDYPFSNKGLDPLDDPYWIESRDAYVRTAIEQVSKQEPVAWRVRLKGNRHWGIWDRNPFDVLMPDQYDIEPLYAAPFSSQNKGEQK
jgi:hypothetical protein